MRKGILLAWKYVNDTQKAQQIVKTTFLLTKAYYTLSLHFFILNSNILDPVLLLKKNSDRHESVQGHFVNLEV